MKRSLKQERALSKSSEVMMLADVDKIYKSFLKNPNRTMHEMILVRIIDF